MKNFFFFSLLCAMQLACKNSTNLENREGWAWAIHNQTGTDSVAVSVIDGWIFIETAHDAKPDPHLMATIEVSSERDYLSAVVVKAVEGAGGKFSIYWNNGSERKQIFTDGYCVVLYQHLEGVTELVRRIHGGIPPSFEQATSIFNEYHAQQMKIRGYETEFTCNDDKTWHRAPLPDSENDEIEARALQTFIGKRYETQKDLSWSVLGQGVIRISFRDTTVIVKHEQHKDPLIDVRIGNETIASYILRENMGRYYMDIVASRKTGELQEIFGEPYDNAESPTFGGLGLASRTLWDHFKQTRNLPLSALREIREYTKWELQKTQE